jgi:hypothetical protein
VFPDTRRDSGPASPQLVTPAGALPAWPECSARRARPARLRAAGRALHRVRLRPGAHDPARVGTAGAHEDLDRERPAQERRPRPATWRTRGLRIARRRRPSPAPGAGTTAARHTPHAGRGAAPMDGPRPMARRPSHWKLAATVGCSQAPLFQCEPSEHSMLSRMRRAAATTLIHCTCSVVAVATR